MTTSNVYQGGKFLELFSAQGVDPLSKLRISGGNTVCKEFDSVIKGYVIVLNGSPATTKIQLPKANRKQLKLAHSVLVLQVLLPDSSRTIFEINVLDSGNNKRRLQLSTLYSRVSATPLQAKVPLDCVPVDEWVWLAIDVSAVLSCVYPSQHLQLINSVSCSGNCRLRRIGTARDGTGALGELPSAWYPPPSAPSLPLVVFDDSVIEVGGIQPTVKNVSKERKPMHVAFGEKIQVPTHVLKQKTQSHSDKRPKPDPTPPPVDTVEPSVSTSSEFLVSPAPNTGSSPGTKSQEPIPVQLSVDQPQSIGHTPFDFKSLPRSVLSERCHSDQGSTSSILTTSSPEYTRGANPEDDFILTKDNEGYDWQKYRGSSSDSSYDEDDESGRGLDHALQLDQTISLANNSNLLTQSTGLDTLKKKLEGLQDEKINTLDVNEMGGAYSPTSSITTATTSDDKVELIYDQDLNCFYDPITGKYYKLTE